MNLKTILMPQGILAKFLSQKSSSYLRFLTEVRFRSFDYVICKISLINISDLKTIQTEMEISWLAWKKSFAHMAMAGISVYLISRIPWVKHFGSENQPRQKWKYHGQPGKKYFICTIVKCFFLS